MKDTMHWYQEEAKPKVEAAPKPFVPNSEEEKRAAEMASALDWLRTNDADLDIDDEESVAMSVATFKMFDSSLSKSENDGPANLDNAFNWLRSKTDTDDETASSFKKKAKGAGASDG
jgi:hypothetical protein